MVALKRESAGVEIMWLLDIVALRDENMKLVACKIIVILYQIITQFQHN